MGLTLHLVYWGCNVVRFFRSTKFKERRKEESDVCVVVKKGSQWKTGRSVSLRMAGNTVCDFYRPLGLVFTLILLFLHLRAPQNCCSSHEDTVHRESITVGVFISPRSGHLSHCGRHFNGCQIDSPRTPFLPFIISLLHSSKLRNYPKNCKTLACTWSQMYSFAL